MTETTRACARGCAMYRRHVVECEDQETCRGCLLRALADLMALQVGPTAYADLVQAMNADQGYATTPKLDITWADVEVTYAPTMAARDEKRPPRARRGSQADE